MPVHAAGVKKTRAGRCAREVTEETGIGVVEVEAVGPAPDRERETRYVVAGSSVQFDL